MKRIITIFIFTCFTSQIFAQSEVLIEIGDDKITTEDFNLVYNKNNSSAQAIDPKTKEEYLEMYINFKLKVKEARDAGMDTMPSFIQELSGYRGQLAEPYLTDQNVTEELIKEAFNRMQFDVNAHHILINVGPDASPKDTFDAFIKCQKIKLGLTNPETQFAEMATKHSNDPSAAKNGGDLGYFNVFQMVYPFESAAYTTEVGKISEPVRTRFGYHLLWIKDKRPARGEIQVAHIMVKTEDGENEESLSKKKQKVDEIYKKLLIGADFDELAKQYSDDKGSSANGGELPMFGTGRMVKSFEDGAFSLKKDGDISEPIQTKYGWHILKRLKKKPIPSYEETKADLKVKVTRDGRGVKSKDAFYARVKLDYNYKPNWKNIDQVASFIDEEYAAHNWRAEDKLKGKSKSIFTLMDKKYVNEKASFNQMELAIRIENDKRFQRKPIVDSIVIVHTIYEEMVKEKLLVFENTRLEAKFPKFKALTQEYHDGILLFDLMDKKVWSKAVQDSSGLLAFYENTKQNYTWEERADAHVFSCANEMGAKEAKAMLESQMDTSLNLVAISNKINEKSQLEISISSGPYKKGDNDFVDQYGWKSGITDIIEKDGRWIFTYTVTLLKPAPKELEEARGLVISAYQDKLEIDWIKELRNKYPIAVNKEFLK